MNEDDASEFDTADASQSVKSGGQKLLALLGIPANVFAALLTARLIWEETALTLQQGPQMIGFSLAHGYGAILFLAPLLLAIWLLAALVALIIVLIRRSPLHKPFLSCLVVGVVILGVLSLPGAFWQYAFISNFAKSPHAADLITSAAAEGDRRTVEAYLSHGVPIESKNYEGSTVLFSAAAGGNLDIVTMLVSRGAQLNATNLYGDSPMSAALGNKNAAVAAFLQKHGAIAIDGTPEQRNSAAETIVRRDMERMHSSEK
jgi:hypothetical protein